MPGLKKSHLFVEGNGRAVRNILESAMRAMSVRVVAEKKAEHGFGLGLGV